MKLPASFVQHRFDSPFGEVVAAASPAGLAGVWFTGQRHFPPKAGGPRSWAIDDAHAVLLQTRGQLLDYFAGRRTGFDLPLDLAFGTPFQQAVWQALLAIPLGRTTSYGAIARGLGSASAVRAVGAAVGRNPISVIVPCHRVVGTGGALTGYAGGLDRKVALLELEGVRGRVAPASSPAGASGVARQD
ncbi:methylated-DNA--[protein]-cysteine S-methyltransferase [Xylophilus sp.]|uniref:methylated-DNA--[protein]-cysteine S-methyltransferase n=1 Tax=Xylophilus sp. TaxID=2653893 RepID=UPI0013BDA3E3|nr:methylated-DNA--[protein]-cysteine S-methyltransferase [Xylophilus sp.]KAF1047314.1 MAG: Methylated-DNA--protein-cysteine methyltransferase [Xylophilus sp.]